MTTRHLFDEDELCRECNELFNLPVYALTLSDLFNISPIDLASWYHQKDHQPWG